MQYELLKLLKFCQSYGHNHKQLFFETVYISVYNISNVIVNVKKLGYCRGLMLTIGRGTLVPRRIVFLSGSKPCISYFVTHGIIPHVSVGK